MTNLPPPPLGATPEPSATHPTQADFDLADRLKNECCPMKYIGDGRHSWSFDEQLAAVIIARELATARAALAQCEERLKAATRVQALQTEEADDDVREKLTNEIIECVRDCEDPDDEIGSKLLYFSRHITQRDAAIISGLKLSLEKSEAYCRKMDGIIEEVGGVTVSCINPYEDLKAAMIAVKARAESSEAKLAQCEEHHQRDEALIVQRTDEIRDLKANMESKGDAIDSLLSTHREQKKTIAALAAAHAKALEDGKQQLEWLPIAELKRDEMQFVLVTDCDVVRLRLWNPFQTRWEPEPPRMGPLTTADECQEPTHFMPIPDLPSAPSVSERQETQ